MNRIPCRKSELQLLITLLILPDPEIVTPRVLVCPSDNRAPAQNFTTNRETGLTWQRNYSVSYFVGLDANLSRSQMRILGDRNACSVG